MNDTPQVSRIVRTAIFVSDLEKSVRFYREALGYSEVYANGVLEHKVGHALIGVPEDSVIRYEIVKADELNFGMVGLFEAKPSPPAFKRENRGANLGEGCMVFFATDIHAVRDRIGSIEQVGGIDAAEFQHMNKALQRLDRFWNDQILYRL